jgi:hypothetical protein
MLQNFLPMKKSKLLLLSCLISTVALSQISQIKIVSFQVKNTLPAKIDDWNTVPAALILTAQKPPTVQLKEPKLVIQIKSNGAVICGNNSATAQPISPFDVKTYTTNELTGMLNNCKELKEGSYQICVQFYNLDRIAISNEVCKEFKVEGAKAAEDYAPPTLITPDNGKIFTEAELRKPLNFRWTPLVPKPQQPVTYRLRVWQLMQGQNGTAAMRSSQPVVEKDVQNVTQAVVTNLYTGPCKPPYLCDFIWTVQALNKEGKPMGRNNGLSEAWNFSVKQNTVTNPNNPPQAMMAGANAEFKIDSAVCLPKENGLFKYHLWGHYKNMASSSNSILINDAINFPGYIANPNPGPGTNLRNNIRMKSGTYNGALTMNDIVEASSGTINNINPLPASGFTPATLAPNSTHNFQFDYTTATNTPVQFTYYGLVDDALKFNANRNARNEIDSLKYPKCPCSACDEVTINVGMQGNITNNGNGGLNFTALVASSPKKVKRIRAELVYFDMKPENENCLICNKNDNFFGNFINATTTNNNFTSTIPYPHSAQLDAPGDINISGGVPISFTVSIPPMVSCCNAGVNFCIRYVITYEDCTVCNKLVCYNYKITGCQK